jgi:hypothetical protein
MYVSGDYFTTLGVLALIGRTITSDDDVRGGGKEGAVAVISYRLWQRQYGGAANAIGRTLTVESVPFTIIGVTPPEFFGTEVGRTFEVAIPIMTTSPIVTRHSYLNATIGSTFVARRAGM